MGTTYLYQDFLRPANFILAMKYTASVAPHHTSRSKSKLPLLGLDAAQLKRLRMRAQLAIMPDGEVLARFVESVRYYFDCISLHHCFAMITRSTWKSL